jgi:hypothetical protein
MKPTPAPTQSPPVKPSGRAWYAPSQNWTAAPLARSTRSEADAHLALARWTADS